jgi:hypothetical protein
MVMALNPHLPLVEKLRLIAAVKTDCGDTWTAGDVMEAANEIERLRVDAARWRWLRKQKSLETDRLNPADWDRIADEALANGA